MRILTWNVLHRVHGEKYDEPAIRAWHAEDERVEGVVSLVVEALRRGESDVALLQEVSGDVLRELRARLPKHAVLNHQYPRIPDARGQTARLRDPSEHLVVVAPPGATVVARRTFDNDPGKGYLGVAVTPTLVVVSTHLGFREKAQPQFALLAAVSGLDKGAVCIGGDFNVERRAVAEALGPTFEIGLLPEGSRRTRPREDATGGRDIDHLIAHGGRLTDLKVLEHRNLSDHRPVVGTWSASGNPSP